MIVVAFTGTRVGANDRQLEALRQLFEEATSGSILLHGGAEGADEQAHDLWKESHLIVEIFPCNISRFEYWTRKSPRSTLIHPIDEPLRRNRRMVSACDRLIAVSETGYEVLQSGTWATIRAARQAGVEHTIIFRSGAYEYFPGRKTSD